MRSAAGIGVLGVGAYLPPDVRRNDWWSEEVVAGWLATRRGALAQLRAAPPPATPAVGRVMQAMIDFGDDPFQGSVLRHVMADSMTSYDLEAEAARAALADAEVGADEIDLVLTHTLVPEYLINNSAFVLHHRLGLPADCFVMQTDATAFSFLAQLTLAQQMIAGGRARRALLVQSCGVTRLVNPIDPVAPLFGDGATAVVVGAVGPAHGLLAAVHRTDTAHPFWLGAGAAGGRWYDEGRGTLWCPDPVGASHVFLDIPDQARDAVDRVLAACDLPASAIDFFAAHQGMPWLRQLAQEHAGLGAARTVDTFPFAASLFSANIPLVLWRAEQDGLLRAGDRVLLFGGGTGVTYGATVLRWGRA